MGRLGRLARRRTDATKNLLDTASLDAGDPYQNRTAEKNAMRTIVVSITIQVMLENLPSWVNIL